MEAKEHLYYAIGLLVYAMAKADGDIQKEEKEKLHKLVLDKTGHSIDFNYAEIVFELMEKDNMSKLDLVYEWSMKNFELGKHHFSAKMKNDCIDLIEAVAQAFSPVTKAEKSLIERFKDDIDKLRINITL